MTITLARADLFVTLNEIGEGVVLETEFNRATSETYGPKAHYFDTRGEAVAFVIQGSSELLEMGYGVVL